MDSKWRRQSTSTSGSHTHILAYRETHCKPAHIHIWMPCTHHIRAKTKTQLGTSEECNYEWADLKDLDDNGPHAEINDDKMP